MQGPKVKILVGLCCGEPGTIVSANILDGVTKYVVRSDIPEKPLYPFGPERWQELVLFEDDFERVEEKL